MVQEEVLFKDGSRIFYKTSNNDVVRRVIQYADGEYIDNAGKYYYLQILENYRDVAEVVFNEIKYIYEMATGKYDKQLAIESCNRIRRLHLGAGTEVFITSIYLAMVDLEADRFCPEGPGKALVLDSCKAVLLDNMPYREAALLGTKYYVPKNHTIGDDEPF